MVDRHDWCGTKETAELQDVSLVIADSWDDSDRRGLGIDDEITSPTFTLSKRYSFKREGKECFLVHYDFYRLNDPGIMSEDLLENIQDKNTITIIEWGDSVSDLLPEDHLRFYISINDDGSRSITK